MWWQGIPTWCNYITVLNKIKMCCCYFNPAVIGKLQKNKYCNYCLNHDHSCTWQLIYACVPFVFCTFSYIFFQFTVKKHKFYPGLSRSFSVQCVLYHVRYQKEYKTSLQSQQSAVAQWV